MGNSLTLMSNELKQQVWVKTRHSKSKIKNFDIFLISYGESQKSKSIQLKIRQWSEGQLITLMNEDGTLFPAVETKEIELWRDDSESDVEWFCDLITVLDLDTGQSIPFPVQRMITPSTRYRIRAFDTCLPQDDPYPEQRQKQLELKQTVYLHNPLLPFVTSETRCFNIEEIYLLPNAEEYPEQTEADDFQRRAQDLLVKYATTSLIRFSTWKKFEDVHKLFFFDQTLPLHEYAKFWKDDEWFAAMRLVNANPKIIRLCTHMPKNFPVTDGLVEPILNGDTLESLIQEKRLFIADLAVMEGVSTVKNYEKTLKMVAPMALFFLNRNKTLMPLAIQLNQQPGPNNPVSSTLGNMWTSLIKLYSALKVKSGGKRALDLPFEDCFSLDVVIFTPADDQNVWILAKLWFGLADSNSHIIITHLGYSHFMTESIAVVTNRNLSQNHPIFRLLAPHFYCVMAAVKHNTEYLINTGGIMDSCYTVGGKETLQLLRKSWDLFKFDLHGSFMDDLEDRGLLSPYILPVYPYRDDGLLVYEATKSYVNDVLNIYYGKNLDDLMKDEELHNWVKKLCLPVLEGGSGVREILKDGKISTLEELVRLCTNIIFNCSAIHSTMHPPQYAFPLNMPSRLVGNPPENKNGLTEEDVMRCLPDNATMLHILVSMRLSPLKYKPLASWDVQYQFDSRILRVEARFRQELKNISKEIERRNQERTMYYQCQYLDPKNIPNSITF